MRSVRKALRSRLPSVASFVGRRPDLPTLLALFALTLLAQWDLLREEITIGSDAATQYYPFYHLLGESLRSGTIPGWNPYQFSGTPFAADPLTGWSYLPAMLLFALLPLVGAAKGLMFSHLLLAGLFTYALGRVLGVGSAGSLLAAIAYQYNGLFYIDNTCCLQYVGVMAWLPLAIAGAELAIRSPSWPRRGLWWGISGLAVSQALASWFGQGSYYALLALGGYVLYRTLLYPPENIGGVKGRVGGLFVHGGAVLVFGACLAAAGVLPRLEYNALSNLAGGYPDEVRAYGGWSVSDWVSLLEPGFWYAGLSVLALALVAPLIARKRFAVPYFSVLALCTLVLTDQGPTPLHSALYLLLPYFERLHPHDPDRVVLIFYLGAALLAGGTLTALEERVVRKSSLLALPILAALLLATVGILFPPKSGGWVALYPVSLKNGVSVPVGSLLFLILAVGLVAAYALLPARLTGWRAAAFAVLALTVFADLLAADRVTIAKQDFSGQGWLVRMREMDLAEYYRPSGAARFLQSKEDEEEPFRYFGYDPGGSGEGSQVSAPLWFADPSTRVLEANGRSMLLGLQNVQGYNPTHIARYDEFMSVLNADQQNYHFVDVYEKGLTSPLLDLLNARYIIVPSHPSQEDPEGLRRFEGLERTHPVVYEDGQTKVLENPEALPRAWLVHSAQQVGSEGAALELLSSGEVDPRETALLQDEPPDKLAQPEGASSDRASVVEYEANRMRLKTATTAPGLLVLSEVYYPAWKAYVDGRPVQVGLADGLLRSVEVPEGEHEVELRYESWPLWGGVALSLIGYAALLALAVVTTAQYRRKSV